MTRRKLKMKQEVEDTLKDDPNMSFCVNVSRLNAVSAFESWSNATGYRWTDWSLWLTL